MQEHIICLLVVIVYLLVHSNGDAMAYFYSDFVCSGRPGAGIGLQLGACQSDNSIYTCSSDGSQLIHTIYKEAGCYGSYTSTTTPTNHCFNMTKVFCFSSLSISKNSFIQYQYSGGTCSGEPIQKYFAILDSCIPSTVANTSVHFIYNESLNAVSMTAWKNQVCAGPGSNVTIPFGSGATYYRNDRFSVPNLVGYYEYADTAECSGTPTEGTAYSLLTYQCYFGTRVTCSNNEFIMKKYKNNDCTGNVTSAISLPQGVCIKGQKAFCSGDFHVPPNNVANMQYHGFQCGDSIRWIQFTILDSCITKDQTDGTKSSKILIYHRANNLITSYTYSNSSTCSPSIFSETPPSSTSIKLVSWTLGLSSAPLMAHSSSLIILLLFIILILILN